MKLAQRLVAVTLLSALSAFASAEIAVVVHPSNKDAIDAKEVERIFLGKSKSFPGAPKPCRSTSLKAVPFAVRLIQGCWASLPAR